MTSNVILLILVIFFIICLIATNYGIKIALKSERKDSQTVLEELLTRFNTDYRSYETLPLEQITIESEDNLKLKGYYHNVYPTSKKVIIINHGYTDNHYVTYQFTDVFFEEGYNVLLIDMRSHGESEGDIASYGYNESKDLGKWVEWIKNKVGEDAYIGLHGQSMGAASVLLYAGINPKDIKFVIEDCGFSTAKEVIIFQLKKAKVPFRLLYSLVRRKTKRLYSFDFNKISPIESIINSTIPTLFIHGTADETVPCWMSKKMYEKKNGPKDMIYIVEGADHMKAYSTDKKKYTDIVRKFLNQI